MILNFAFALRYFGSIGYDTLFWNLGLFRQFFDLIVILLYFLVAEEAQKVWIFLFDWVVYDQNKGKKLSGLYRKIKLKLKFASPFCILLAYKRECPSLVFKIWSGSCLYLSFDLFSHCYCFWYFVFDIFCILVLIMLWCWKFWILVFVNVRDEED